MIDVEQARRTIAGRVHRTPTFSSAALGAHLKAELFQKTGSFKARGALNRIAALTPEERQRGVVTWSAGNHAQAVAWASAQYDVDCLVSMWEGVNPGKVEATRNVDPDLIGGVVLQAGSLRVDASVRGRLERLHRELVTNR